MTFPHDPHEPHPLDELASAHLDDHTTEAEAARIAADPELADRVAAMAQARDALRSDLPRVDDARRERAIAAALAAFDAVEAVAPVAPAPPEGEPAPRRIAALAPLVSLDARRATARRRLRLVGAAAAVLLAVALPVLSRLGSDGSDDVASSALDEAGGSAESGGGAEGGDVAREGTAGNGAEDAMSAAPELAAMDLGSFADMAGLTSAVRTLLGEPAASTTASTTASDPAAVLAAPAPGCPEPLPGSPPEGTPPTLRATATLEGRPVVVSVYETAPGERALVVVDGADCTVVSTTAL